MLLLLLFGVKEPTRGGVVGLEGGDPGHEEGDVLGLVGGVLVHAAEGGVLGRAAGGVLGHAAEGGGVPGHEEEEDAHEADDGVGGAREEDGAEDGGVGGDRGVAEEGPVVPRRRAPARVRLPARAPAFLPDPPPWELLACRGSHSLRSYRFGRHSTC